MRCLMKKSFGGALMPADDMATEVFENIKNGELVMVTILKPRNLKHHRLYWGLVSLVWDQCDQDRYPTRSDLHNALKIFAGIRTRIVLPDGTKGFIPGSVSFSSMDQMAFNQFYDTICDIVARDVLPGIDERDLRMEVESMIL